MPSSRSRHSTDGLGTELPYDVLREIFTHCLPQYPLEIPQPDVTVAPMLLCQICSSWRTVALASPSLWSHLSYFINARYIDSELGSWAFRQTEVDFILWWKGNQGSIAPFLHLDINIDEVDHEYTLAEDGRGVLLQYVASVQYLQVEPLFWDRIHSKTGIWDDPDEVVFSNLHTLATYGPGDDIEYYDYATQLLVKLALTRTPSLLRRLAIHNDRLTDNTITPKHLSALTHLSMSNITVSLEFWFSFVRTVPNLQWAYIVFDKIYITWEHSQPTAKYTLSQLSALFITCTANHSSGHLALPLTLIFSALYLPALHTLSLSCKADFWKDHRAISEIYTVLSSTPALETLALRGYGFLSLHDGNYPMTLIAIGAIEPIWDHAPHLTNLRLELPNLEGCSEDRARGVLDIFFRNISMSDRSWLVLDSLGCPIQTITLVIGEIYWSPWKINARDLTMLAIQKYFGGVSNITFKVISASEDDTGADAWKEWGSRNF